MIEDSAEHYLALAQRFKAEQLPVGTQWREVEAYREKQVASKVRSSASLFSVSLSLCLCQCLRWRLTE